MEGSNKHCILSLIWRDTALHESHEHTERPTRKDRSTLCNFFQNFQESTTIFTERIQQCSWKPHKRLLGIQLRQLYQKDSLTASTEQSLLHETENIPTQEFLSPLEFQAPQKRLPQHNYYHSIWLAPSRSSKSRLDQMRKEKREITMRNQEITMRNQANRNHSCYSLQQQVRNKSYEHLKDIVAESKLNRIRKELTDICAKKGVNKLRLIR